MMNWSKKENDKLTDLILKHGKHDFRQIALAMEPRTETQCWHRWNKISDPSIKSGNWQPGEDMKAILSYRFYKNDIDKSLPMIEWVKLEPHMAGRTGMKVRERYMSVLGPRKFKYAWNEHDNMKLVNLVESDGRRKWKNVSLKFVNCTSFDCKKQYFKLRPRERKKRGARRKLMSSDDNSSLDDFIV
eukprot:UN31624